MRIFNRLYNFLSSVRLTIVLFVLILVSCIAGTALLPGPAARWFIFSSIWFNALLVFLIINIAFCFFPKIWRRKIDLIFAGMIIFHLSFVLLFIGIVYDGLFYFRGAIRLTEGETLSIAEPQSYDLAEWGRFFDHSKLSGFITLNKLHTHYFVKDKDRGIADDITIVDGNSRMNGVAYVTNAVDYKGFDFYRNKDGFSPLLVLWNRKGNELYGVYVPLQSLPQKSNTKKYLYTTGTAEGPGGIPFPQDLMSPVMNVRVEYHLPERVDGEKRVSFRVRQYDSAHGADSAAREAAIGEKVRAGDYYLSVEEVRYWASIDVRHNPGLPLIFTSLWLGFGGIILTTVARLIKKK